MLVNCIVCGRLFKSDNDNICARCTDDEDGPYVHVREYLYKNRGASALEVSEATGVSISNILKYIKDNRISLIGEKSLLARCNSCGEFIDSGSYCRSCMDKENSKNPPKLTSLGASKDNKFGSRSRRR